CHKAAQDGDIIAVAPGRYGAIVLTGTGKAVTVTAADPANRPQFTDRLYVNGSNLTLRGVEVIASIDTPLQLSGTGNTVDQVEIHSDTTDPLSYHRGFITRGATNATVTNNYIHDLSSGFTALSTTDTLIAGNLFTRITDDALFLTGTTRTKVTG